MLGMSFGDPSAALTRFAPRVQEFCAWQPDIDEVDCLAADLILLRTLINRLELDFARRASLFAQTYTEEQFFNPSAVSWMREACRMTSHSAASAVCVGDEEPMLQASTAALEEGRIGYAHLGWMASTAKFVRESPAGAARFDEAALLRHATRQSVQRFRTVCEHVRHAADRDTFLAEQVDDHEYRKLTLTSFEGGGLQLTGYLDREGGAVVHTSLDALARRHGIEDRRSREQRYADALVELCAHRLDAGDLPDSGGQRPHLQVTTTLETLRNLPGAPAGEVDRGGLLAAATVQRLACDATISRVLVDARSQVIDVGRSTRVTPTAARRALTVRDGGCRWPGCDRPASWTASHHVLHWGAHLGPTDRENLVLVCRHHHRCVHEGGWTMLAGEDEILVLSPVTHSMTPLRPPNTLPAPGFGVIGGRGGGALPRAREPALAAP